MERKATEEEIKNTIISKKGFEFIKEQLQHKNENEYPVLFRLKRAEEHIENSFMFKIFAYNSKLVYERQFSNTVIEYLDDNNERKSSVMSYMNVLIKYNDKNKDEMFIKAAYKLAERFNKAVYRNIIGHGCLLKLSYMEIQPENNDKRALMMVWPASKINDVKEMNRRMDEIAFYAEGEMPEYQPEIFVDMK